MLRGRRAGVFMGGDVLRGRYLVAGECHAGRTQELLQERVALGVGRVVVEKVGGLVLVHISACDGRRAAHGRMARGTDEWLMDARLGGMLYERRDGHGRGGVCASASRHAAMCGWHCETTRSSARHRAHHSNQSVPMRALR